MACRDEKPYRKHVSMTGGYCLPEICLLTKPLIDQFYIQEKAISLALIALLSGVFAATMAVQGSTPPYTT